MYFASRSARGADCDDRVAGYDYGAVVDDGARGVHGYDHAAGDEEVGLLSPFLGQERCGDGELKN